MKGKIRVYCRIRPMLSSEIERNHKTVVTRKDELTLQIETKQGPKLHVFDSVFDEKSTQVIFIKKIFLIFKSFIIFKFFLIFEIFVIF